MGLFRRLAGFLGIAKDEAEELKEEDENDAVSTSAAAQHPQRKGFSVPVQVPVDRPLTGPVLVPCSSGNGGVQVKISLQILLLFQFWLKLLTGCVVICEISDTERLKLQNLVELAWI